MGTKENKIVKRENDKKKVVFNWKLLEQNEFNITMDDQDAKFKHEFWTILQCIEF